MICQNCSSSLADGQAFCDKCGSKTTPETLASVSDRLARIETRLAASSAGAKEQKYLERETAENVMTRVRTWTTLVLFFTGIPVAATLIALAVIFGKADFDLHKIAANARQSVGAVLTDAQAVAASTSKTVNEARTTSNQVNAEIKSTQRRVEQLKGEVESRSAEVKKLDAKIRDSEASVATVAAQVQTEAQKVTQLSQRLQAAETGKNVALIRNLYTQVYGELVAGSYEGWIDPKVKKPGDIWVAIQLATMGKPNRVSDVKFAEVIQSLRESGYTVFLGGVSLSKVAGRTSTGGGATFDENSCTRLGNSPAPCILYFREDSKDKIPKLRGLVSPAQEIPESNVRLAYGMTDLEKVLLEKSAVDFVVILGAN